MSKRHLQTLVLIGGIVLLSAPSCDVNAPDPVVREPVIRGFTPRTATVDVFVGDTLSFSVRAVDPGGEKLRVYYTLADSIVWRGALWRYVVEDSGVTRVRANVVNPGAETFIEWQVRRTQPENQRPVIVDFQPPDARPAVIVGDPIEFSVTAEDPEGEPLSYIFTADDSIVAASNQYTFVSTAVGPVVIKAIVSDGGRFTEQRWDLTVLAQPDSILPAKVVIQSLQTGAEPGELVVQWIAVGDDSLDGLPSGYIVRTASTPIVDEHKWNVASERSGSPAPAPAGDVETMVIRSLKPATLVYVAVRAVDDFGNLSPLSDTPGGTTRGMKVLGTIRDAVTGDPLGGVHVSILGVRDTTGVDGRFLLAELPDATVPVHVHDEETPGVVGAYFDIDTEPHTIQHNEQLDFWMLPNLTLQTKEYPSFLEFFRAMMRVDGGLGNSLRTWDYPVDVYIKPAVFHGIDYALRMKTYFNAWETATGLQLFTFVDTIPPLGVHIDYSSSITADFYLVEEADPFLLPIVGLITMRTVYDSTSLNVFRTIGMHEVGHSFGFAHSLDPGHLMIGGVTATVSGPTQDEIWLARAVFHLPRGFRAVWIQPE